MIDPAKLTDREIDAMLEGAIAGEVKAKNTATLMEYAAMRNALVKERHLRMRARHRGAIDG